MNVTVCMAIEDKNMLNPDCLINLFKQDVKDGVYNILLVNYEGDYVANYYHNKYAKQYPNLKQIKIENNFKGNIKNQVMNDIDTEYVIFIDGETILDHNAITEFDKLSLDSENDLVVVQVNPIANGRKKNREHARILEDELLKKCNRIAMFKTAVIKEAKLEFILDKQFANEAFYIDYLANSYGVGTINNTIFTIDRYARSTNAVITKHEYLKVQEKMLIALSTGVAMTTENKIQAISQQYLNILHGDMNKYYLINREDEVDSKIWLRDFAKLTERYLLPPCMRYIPAKEQNLIRAIKHNNLVEIDLYLNNQKISQKLNQKIKKINNKVIKEVQSKPNKELSESLQHDLNLTANKLMVVEKRINEMMGR